MLKFAAITPHPPIIVPTIGRPSDLKIVSKTIEGMEKLAERFGKAKPETIILISPHGPLDWHNFTVINSPVLAGHFYNFGDLQTELVFRNDEKLIKAIQRECRNAEIPLKTLTLKELDHGALVPLYYLSQGHPNFKLLPLTFSYLDLQSHFKFGQILQKIVSGERFSANYGIVASGDLSHKLTTNAPAGYSPRGKEFDEKLVELLKKRDVKGILNLDPDLVEDAGECGYRSIAILLGALDGLKWKPEILSYEGPFGVGYLVANFKIK